MDVERINRQKRFEIYYKSKYDFLFRYPLSFSVYVFVFFIVGVALAYAFKNTDIVSPLVIYSSCLLVFIVILSLCLRFLNAFVIATVLSVISLVFGYSYTSLKYYDTFRSPIKQYELDAEDIDDSVIKAFKAKVVSYDGLNVNKHTYTIDVSSIYYDSNWHNYSSKIRLYSHNDYIFGVNDIITSTAKLGLYKNMFTNFVDDEREQIIYMLEKKSLVGVATSYDYKNIVLIKEGVSIYNYLGERFMPLRLFIKKALSTHMGSLNYSVAQCILIGDKYILPYPIQEVFQRVGISHILSVSGLHLSIVYFLIFSFLSICRVPFHYRLVFATLIIITIYLPLTLFAIPILRSSIMMLIVTISLLFDRTKNVLNILLLTAFILIVNNPDVIKEISFQFSFLATFSLIIYMPMVAKLTKPLPMLPKIIIDFFAVSIFANIILLPLTSHYFGTIVLTSVLANIYAVPITFAIIVLDILIVVLYAINPSFASLPSSLNNTLVDMMIVFSRWLGDKNILYYEYNMSFNRAIVLTVVMIVVSIILYCIFHKKQFNDLMR